MFLFLLAAVDCRVADIFKYVQETRTGPSVTPHLCGLSVLNTSADAKRKEMQSLPLEFLHYSVDGLGAASQKKHHGLVAARDIRQNVQQKNPPFFPEDSPASISQIVFQMRL